MCRSRALCRQHHLHEPMAIAVTLRLWGRDAYFDQRAAGACALGTPEKRTYGYDSMPLWHLFLLSGILQSGKFLLCLLQEFGVRISVGPESKEVSISIHRSGTISFCGERLTESEPR